MSLQVGRVVFWPASPEAGWDLRNLLRRAPRLFNRGSYTLHSGAASMFKIDCDALTGADLDAVAAELFVRLPAFGRVVGIPRGGLRLAQALRRYVSDSDRVLVVDDVMTTGRSLEQARASLPPGDRARARGAVVFARGESPGLEWVTPLFRMAP